MAVPPDREPTPVQSFPTFTADLHRLADWSSANRAAAILRLAAMNLGRTRNALGTFDRRLAFWVGKAKAVTATARKLAVLVYRTLTDHLVYVAPGAAAYDAQDRARVLRRLRQRADNLGFWLVNLSTGEVVEGAVSEEAVPAS